MAENSYIIAGLQFLNEVKGVLLGNRPDQIKLKKGASGVKALQHICKSDYAQTTPHRGLIENDVATVLFL